MNHPSRPTKLAPSASLFRVFLIIATVSGAAPAQPLELDDPAMPDSWLRARLDPLEQRIAERTAAMVDADIARRVLLEVDRNLHILAFQLLSTTHDDPEYPVKLLYGLTIAKSADQFYPLIESLPDHIARLTRKGDADGGAAEDRPQAPLELERLVRAVDAIKRFNAGFEQAPALCAEAADLAALDQCLQRRLVDLVDVLEQLERLPPLLSTWAPEDGQARRPFEPGEPPDFQALGQRIDAAPLPAPARASLERMNAMMQRGWALAHLRPTISRLSEQVETALEIAAAIGQADWLKPATVQAMVDRLATVIDQLAKPDQRAAAAKQLDQLGRQTALMRQLTEMGGDRLPLTELRQLFAAAQRVAGQPDQAAAAERLMGFLGRLSQTIQRVRQLPQRTLPLDIRRVSAQVRREYDQVEARLIESLDELLAEPAQLSSPRPTAWLGELVDRAEQLRLLNEVPQWITRTSQLNPVASRNIYRQLRTIATDLLDPALATGAAAALAEMEKQLDLFEQLPHEGALRQAGSPVRQLCGEHAEGIQQQMMILRSQWAAAWSAGSDPTVAGNRLLMLRDLLGWLHDGSVLTTEQQAIDQLNRWSAWEVSAEAIAPLRQWLLARLEVAAAAAASGDWEALDDRLNQMRALAPVARLVSQAVWRMTPVLEQVPQGPAGMLCQCLFPPQADAYGADHRPDLARISLYLTAADHLRQSGRNDEADRLLNACGRIAERILRQAESARPRLRPDAKPPAPAEQPDAVDV